MSTLKISISFVLQHNFFTGYTYLILKFIVHLQPMVMMNDDEDNPTVDEDNPTVDDGSRRETRASSKGK